MNNLDYLFKAKSVVVIGASRRKGSVGQGVLHSLLEGGVFGSRYNKKFKGKICAVNPNAKSVLGVKCYKSILEIKGKIDVAVFCIPAKFVPYVMKECADKEVKVAIVISAGFSEFGEQGKQLQQEMLTIAKKAQISIVGPNCLGIIRPANSMNASFAPCMPPEGDVAFVSQSGALADSIIDWAIESRYGMSAVVSYGNKADMEVYDYMDWFKDDKETKSIALYIEGLKDGRKFMKIAKETSKKKPVVAIKGGRTEEGQKAISSHTGSLAGSYDTYLTAFKQSNVIVADTVEELFDLAKALAEQPPVKKNAIVVITNGGGCGVLCADYLAGFGLNIVKLKESTLNKLDATKLMHPAYSRRNPLDIVGDALPERYKAAINTVLAEDYVGGIIVLQTLQTTTDPLEDAKIIVEAKKKYPAKAIVCGYMGGLYSEAGHKYLEEHNIPDYNDPRKAAKAMWALVERGKQI